MKYKANPRYVRPIGSILDAAVLNTMEFLRQGPQKEKTIKRTGNKKALHQKKANKVKTWN